jgi:hypothetical protein
VAGRRASGEAFIRRDGPVDVVGQGRVARDVDAGRDAAATDDGEVERLGGGLVAPAAQVRAQRNALAL